MVPDDASFCVTTQEIPFLGPAYLKALLTEFAAATNATSYHISQGEPAQEPAQENQSTQ